MVLKYCKQLGVGLVLSALAATAGAQVQVRDDTGQMVTLNAPARRVISLAPHVTELIYAAGGGARLVGVVSHSDYPEAAKQVPGFTRLNAYRQDHIILVDGSAWTSTGGPLLMNRLVDDVRNALG